MLRITTNGNITAKHHWQPGETTWEDLVARLTTDSPADSKEGAGAYVLGRYKRDRRLGDELVARSAITLDVDQHDPGFPARLEALGVDAAWHTTYNSEPGKEKYRAVIRTDRDMTPQEYEHIVLALIHELGDSIDLASARPNQAMFWPAAKHPFTHKSHVVPGVLLPVDEWLRKPRPGGVPARVSKTLRRKDPFSLAGVPGAFNRAYPDLDALIDAYGLPYVAEGGRWRHVDAVSQPAVREIAPGLWFSDHTATDPAADGHAHSAFDLVRIHNYGDEDPESDCPVNRLPSHQALCEAARFDPAVAVELNGGVDDWRTQLVRDNKGRVLDCAENHRLLVEHDPDLSRIGMMHGRLAVAPGVQLGWDHHPRQSPYISRNEHAVAINTLNLRYGALLKRATIADLLDMCGAVRKVDPVRDWLLGLKWDGVPRVLEALPVAKHTDYTRLAARVSLVGAVARAMEPGCQHDTMAVLVGPQGVGKTSWVRFMAVNPDWMVSLPQVNKMSAKDIRRVLPGAWFGLLDELTASRGGDYAVLKSLITETSDNVDQKYRDATNEPRRATLWATTNTKRFLSATEDSGNRRFLPVVVDATAAVKARDPQWVEQVWAEAVHLYQKDAQWWLSPEEQKLVEEAQRPFLDDRGVWAAVSLWFNLDVPENWDTMSVDDRRRVAFGGEPLGAAAFAEREYRPKSITVRDVEMLLPGMRWAASADKQGDDVIRGALNACPGLKPAGEKRTVWGVVDTWELAPS